MPSVVTGLLLGMSWMDPDWLLHQFGGSLFWIALAMVFVECGLFFPFLPGDTLLFATGLFIATGDISVVNGHHAAGLLVALVLLAAAGFLGNVVGFEVGRAVGPPLYQRNGRILKSRYVDNARAFSTSTAVRRWSLAGSSRSSARSSPSWPA